MCSDILSNSKTKQDLIQDLLKLSRVYITAPIQQNKYDEILDELREIYRRGRNSFSVEEVALINKLKKKIEQKPLSQFEMKLRLLNFFQKEKCTEARHYVRAKPYVIPSKTLVFHKTEYFIGVTVDWNPVQRTHKLLICTSNDCEWHRLDDLIVIGTCSKIWESTRETYCWNCKESLGIGDKKCRRCSWYTCPECAACNCNRT